MKNKKKAQAWYVDYIISFLIFMIAIFIFLNYYNPTQKENNLIFQSEILSDTFLSEGIPYNWYEEEIIKIGLITNGSIDQKKLNQLNSIDYNEAIKYIPITSNFIVSIYNSSEEIFSYGYPEYNMSSKINSKEIVTLKRIVIYNGKLINLEVKVW